MSAFWPVLNTAQACESPGGDLVVVVGGCYTWEAGGRLDVAVTSPPPHSPLRLHTDTTAAQHLLHLLTSAPAHHFAAGAATIKCHKLKIVFIWHSIWIKTAASREVRLVLSIDLNRQSTKKRTLDKWDTINQFRDFQLKVRHHHHHKFTDPAKQCWYFWRRSSHERTWITSWINNECQNSFSVFKCFSLLIFFHFFIDPNWSVQTWKGYRTSI